MVMKTLILLIAIVLVMVVSAAAMFPSSQSVGTNNHTEWIAKRLKEIETVKVDMTRADLLKVFREEGGIATRTWQRYVYRDCPYIKVKVEFEAVGEPEKRSYGPRDRITKISQPFLEWEILD